MGAGPNAKPIGGDGWTRDGRPVPASDLPTFTCQDEACSYHGRADELLEDGDDNDTLYCPACGLANWIFD